MRKRNPEQELQTPDLDYLVTQEQLNGQTDRPESFASRVSQAYAEFDQHRDLPRFNQTLIELDTEARKQRQMTSQSPTG